MAWLLVISYIGFLLIIYQDLKDRMISWYAFLLVFLGGIIPEFRSFSTAIPELLIKAGFILAIVLILWLYIRFRKLSNMIGSGDLIFFFAVVPYFSAEIFIYNFVASLVFSLLVILILAIVKKQPTVIPLAGLQSIYFVGFITYSLITWI